MSMDISEVPNVERQTSGSLSIPERRVVVKDHNDLPTDYSTTPGGTIFSTTPGGQFHMWSWGASPRFLSRQDLQDY